MPGFGNASYVSALTDKITATYRYGYQESREANLTTTFLAVATICGKYMLGVDGREVNNVWCKDFRFVPAETKTESTKFVSIQREVKIPFAEYRRTLEGYRTSLELPIISDMQVLFSVRTTGEIDGSPIDDVRSSILTMPLDQPLYIIANKFDKSDKKKVAGKGAKDTQAQMRMIERIAAGSLSLVGIAAIVLGCASRYLTRHVSVNWIKSTDTTMVSSKQVDVRILQRRRLCQFKVSTICSISKKN